MKFLFVSSAHVFRVLFIFSLLHSRRFSMRSDSCGFSSVLLDFVDCLDFRRFFLPVSSRCIRAHAFLLLFCWCPGNPISAPSLSREFIDFYGPISILRSLFLFLFAFCYSCFFLVSSCCRSADVEANFGAMVVLLCWIRKSNFSQMVSKFGFYVLKRFSRKLCK